ncbi:MAG: EscU/YscU/HrcU family type III secretion system export apparatus switch protein [Planctomycetota bacterium]
MSERIHPPTPRKRQRAREQGRSPNLDAVQSSLLILGSCMVLSWLGPRLAAGLSQLMSEALAFPSSQSDATENAIRFKRTLLQAGSLLLPWLTGCMVIVLSIRVLPRRFQARFQRLQPSLEKLSPIARMTLLLSAKSLTEFMIRVLQVITMLVAAALLVRASLYEIVSLPGLPLAQLGSAVFGLLVRCVVWSGGVMLMFSVADFALQWWHFEKSLMMTEQELREEMREMQRASPAGQSARSNRVEGVSG